MGGPTWSALDFAFITQGSYAKDANYWLVKYLALFLEFVAGLSLGSRCPRAILASATRATRKFRFLRYGERMCLPHSTKT